jgi:hypothetical protein
MTHWCCKKGLRRGLPFWGPCHHLWLQGLGQKNLKECNGLKLLITVIRGLLCVVFVSTKPAKSVAKCQIIVKSSVADPGCLSRIPDPTFFHPGSRIRLFSIPDPNFLHPGSRILIKGFKYFYFNPKKSKKMVAKL